MDITKRRGKFRFDQEQLRKALQTDPSVLQQVMSKVIVVEAFANFMEDVVEYSAYSELFEEVPFGYEVPFYVPIISSVIINPNDPPQVVFSEFRRTQ